MSYILDIIIIIIALSIHEFAHAWTAVHLGDLTPKVQGRYTINPLKHIDILGFLAMLFVRLGWSKPVPVNPYNFENPEKGMLLVAIAGPISNVVLALIFKLLLVILLPVVNTAEIGIVPAMLYYMATSGIYLNLALAIFNLIPIPPLDGSRIFIAILPKKFKYYYSLLEKYGFIIVALLIMPITPIGIIGSTLLEKTISAVAEWLISVGI